MIVVGSAFNLPILTESDIPTPRRPDQGRGMPRPLRPYFPGATFHLTARTRGGERWFDDATKSFVCECLATVQRRCDARIIAFAVMPNHIHLVLEQGTLPLNHFMQPLLTRIAISVRNKYRLDGHIFGRRYWAHPCLTHEYLRTCVSYVHHNPVRAELCADPAAYAWSSAACYGGGSAPCGVVVEPPVQLLATSPSSLTGAPTYSHVRPAPTIDRIVAQTLKEFAERLDIEMLRALRGRTASRIRRVCIRRAVQAGYRNYQIARYMCVSESLVSLIAVEVRGNAALQA